MERMEEYFLNHIKKLSGQQKALFISVFVAGLISHGYMFVNNISYHDAVLMTDGLGATYSLGRWSLGIMEYFGKKFIGLYGSPLFHGILSLLLIALSGMLIVSILRMKHVLSAVYMGIMLAVFPVVTSIFAFMYTSSAYWMAFFLNTFVVYLLTRKQSLKNLCIGGFLLAFALGLYQAYFAVAVALFIMVLMVDILEEPSIRSKEILRKGVWYFLTLLGGLVLYLVLNRVIVTVGKIGLSSYQGMDEVGKIELKKIPLLIRNAYYYLLCDVEWNGVNSVPLLRYIVGGIGIVTLCIFLGIVLKGVKASTTKLILLALMLVLPVGINAVYLMSSSDSYSVHTLMRYSLVLFFILPVLLLEHTNLLQIRNRQALFLKNGVENILLALLWILPMCYIYLNNAAYLKVDFLQEQTIAYYTTLITEIKGTEGYRDEMPVVYIGERKIEDASLTEMPFFEDIKINGYDQDLLTSINNYAWRVFAGRHCGYFPEENMDRTAYAEMPEVAEMPCYPDAGSIKVINGTVVVKFSE